VNSIWNFRRGERRAELEPPDDAPVGAKTALEDFLWAEIGYSAANLAHYRKTWDQIAAREIPRTGISGNSTSQHLDGDEVMLRALFDQWPAVRISREQFEAFLDQFGDFLRSSGSGA
jgi:hypothetical protein